MIIIIIIIIIIIYFSSGKNTSKSAFLLPDDTSQIAEYEKKYFLNAEGPDEIQLPVSVLALVASFSNHNLQHSLNGTSVFFY